MLICVYVSVGCILCYTRHVYMYNVYVLTYSCIEDIIVDISEWWVGVVGCHVGAIWTYINKTLHA